MPFADLVLTPLSPLIYRSPCEPSPSIPPPLPSLTLSRNPLLPSTPPPRLPSSFPTPTPEPAPSLLEELPPSLPLPRLPPPSNGLLPTTALLLRRSPTRPLPTMERRKSRRELEESSLRLGICLELFGEWLERVGRRLRGWKEVVLGRQGKEREDRDWTRFRSSPSSNSSLFLSTSPRTRSFSPFAFLLFCIFRLSSHSLHPQ
ncbi:hypothetical protein BDY24DRAFT_385026 [Mrakia frigida]|uniref:uncharacterized protein n=1 Tax=Mrakia frigida TaxID=29902 RepID=UPI003FCC00EC